MASRADRAAIGIISVIHGAVRVLLSENRLSRVDIKDDLKFLDQYCTDIRAVWSTGYAEKDIIWTLAKIDNWARFLDTLNISGNLRTQVLIKIGYIASGDLLDKLNNPPKKRFIQRLYSEMEKLDAFLDPTGNAFSSLEQADKLLSSLYKEIGFEL